MPKKLLLALNCFWWSESFVPCLKRFSLYVPNSKNLHLLHDNIKVCFLLSISCITLQVGTKYFSWYFLLVYSFFLKVNVRFLKISMVHLLYFSRYWKISQMNFFCQSAKMWTLPGENIWYIWNLKSLLLRIMHFKLHYIQ